MKDAGYVLSRYLVEAFPTDEQLEAMRAAQAAIDEGDADGGRMVRPSQANLA